MRSQSSNLGELIPFSLSSHFLSIVNFLGLICSYCVCVTFTVWLRIGIFLALSKCRRLQSFLQYMRLYALFNAMLSSSRWFIMKVMSPFQ